MTIRKTLVILAHAFVGWALCAATMGIGPTVTTMETTLILHAIGAPIFFFFVSWVYFTKFNDMSPLQTALIFVGFVIAVDFLLVALVILRNLEMFTSVLGTWLPFTLIFISTYLTGTWVNRDRSSLPRPA